MGARKERIMNVLKNPTVLKSWAIAAAGFARACRKERKVRLAFVIMALSLGTALLTGVSHIEFLLIFTAWTQVVVGEIFNTSLEQAVDYASGKEYHPLIKHSKDYAAASVFVLSVLATVVTVFILGRYFLGQEA